MSGTWFYVAEGNGGYVAVVVGEVLERVEEILPWGYVMVEFVHRAAAVAAPENWLAEKVWFGRVGGLGRDGGELGFAEEHEVGGAGVGVARVGGLGRDGGELGLAEEHEVGGTGVGVALVVVPAVAPVVVKLELPGMAGEVGREEAIQAAAENKGWLRDGRSWTWLVRTGRKGMRIGC